MFVSKIPQFSPLSVNKLQPSGVAKCVLIENYRHDAGIFLVTGKRKTTHRSDDSQVLRRTNWVQAALRGLQQNGILYWKSNSIVVVYLCRPACEGNDHVEGRDRRARWNLGGKSIELPGLLVTRLFQNPQ
jgi:hypothetical protein